MAMEYSNEKLCEILREIITTRVENMKWQLINALKASNYRIVATHGADVVELCRFLEYLNTKSLEMYFADTNRNIPMPLPG